MKVWEPVEGTILDAKGLFIEDDKSGGWLLRFGKDGASIWFPDSVHLCACVEQPDAPAVMTPERVAAIEIILAASRHYAPAPVVEAQKIVRAWLAALGQEA